MYVFGLSRYEERPFCWGGIGVANQPCDVSFVPLFNQSEPLNSVDLWRALGRRDRGHQSVAVPSVLRELLHGTGVSLIRLTPSETLGFALQRADSTSSTLHA